MEAFNAVTEYMEHSVCSSVSVHGSLCFGAGCGWSACAQHIVVGTCSQCWEAKVELIHSDYSILTCLFSHTICWFKNCQREWQTILKTGIKRFLPLLLFLAGLVLSFFYIVTWTEYQNASILTTRIPVRTINCHFTADKRRGTKQHSNLPSTLQTCWSHPRLVLESVIATSWAWVYCHSVRMRWHSVWRHWNRIKCDSK